MVKQLRLMTLTFIFSMMSLAFIQAQLSFNIKGKIMEDSESPVIGASVFIKNTNIGTISDIDGNYELTGSLAEGEYQVEVSYLGYSNKTMPFSLSSQSTSATIDFLITEDLNKLDEVVVTGSSNTATRKQLGNAITSVSGKELEKSGTGNALTALQGRVPGARITQTSGDPAGSININLRGVNSISGSSDPLYVVDGVIVSNSATAVTQVGNNAGEGVVGTPRLADLNQNDIESINVISGAAAAAQYGSRAANGVVIITTKRGTASGKPSISVGTSFNINQLRKRVYITKIGKQFGWAGLRLGNISNVSDAQLAANPGSTAVKIERDGTPINLANNIVDVTRYDYQDYLFRQGTGTDNFINVTGGSEKTKYFASVGYMKNEGITIGTDFSRVNARLNLDQILSKWASLSIGVNAINSKSNDLPTGNVFWSPVNSINITNNIFDIRERDANGNLKAAEPTRINPLSIETFEIQQNVNRAITSAKLSLFPFEGLKLDIIGGLDGFSQVGTQYIPLYPYAGVNAAFYANGFASTANNVSLQYNTDINLSYNKNFGDFSSNTLVGYNYQNSRVDLTIASGENIAPGFKSVNGSPNRLVNYAQSRFWIDGYFGQQTFGYKDFVYLTGAVRVDNSSVFSANQRNQKYTKASLSFVPSSMDFWNGSLSNMISTAKLRASFGEAGGVAAINPYDRFNLISSANYLGKNTLIPNAQLAFENIAPERTREFEFGGDFGFLKDRLGLGITIYNQKVFDLLVNRVLAPSEGGTSRLDNVGEMKNNGIELSLNFKPISSKNMDWNIYGIYSKNKNEVTKLGSPVASITNSAGAPAVLLEGYPASVFYGTYTAKNADGSDLLNTSNFTQTEKGTAVSYKGGEIPAGSYVLGGLLYTPVRNASGQPSGSALRKVIGDPNPDFTMSLGTNLKWKKLSFGLLLDGVYGLDVFNADRRTRQGVGVGDYAEKELTGELPRGYIYSIYVNESWRVEDGSFTKLREISLGYDMPTSFIKGLTGLSLSVIGRNLHSFDSYDGFDPETNAGGVSDRLRGIDFGNVPIPRTIQFALKASF